MDVKIISVFTVYFEDPFWVGLLEEYYNENHYVGRHVFGAEPSNARLLYFYLYQLPHIKKVKAEGGVADKKEIGYKRSIREAKKAQHAVGGISKAKEAYKREIENEKSVKTKREKLIIAARNELAYKKIVEKKKKKRKGH